jgi:hypothetical protein
LFIQNTPQTLVGPHFLEGYAPDLSPSDEGTLSDLPQEQTDNLNCLLTFQATMALAILQILDFNSRDISSEKVVVQNSPTLFHSLLIDLPDDD